MTDSLPILDGSSAVVRAAKDISFGSVAGITAKFFEHPFDLCKVRLQTQVMDHTARFSGPVDCLVQTYRNEGFRGLFRGIPAPIVGAMAENASLFLSYREIQNSIRWTVGIPSSDDLSLPYLGLAAACAGSVTSFVLTPIELVKCKMQVQMLVSSPTPGNKLPGPISIIQSIIRASGIRGLWLGHTGTFIRETGGAAAWFSSKEFTASLLLSRRASLMSSSTKLTKKDLLPWESAVSGASAGVLYNLILFPADTVKSTIQTEEELRPRAKGVPGPTFFGMFKSMYAKQGLKGLYAGCGITIARSVPSSALIFLIYDGLSRKFP